GTVFSMAAVVLDEIKSDKEKSFFMLANIAGILLASISFLLLYFYGGKLSINKTAYLSNIALGRATAAILVSALAFVYMMSKAKSVDSFSDAFFITHRAFAVSAIYGLVIMIGTSGVLGAFQALVYRGMNYRVYQYLGVAVVFLTYTIFLGYFPNFRQVDHTNELEIERIKEQPRFVFVLLDYILIPIMMALTVVLLIWSLRVILKGVEVSFNALSGIASSYVIVGIWLHMMVAKHETKIAEFYKRVYPLAGILILIFEAWALFVQLSKFGLKTAEYSFLMIWIFAMISVLLLVFLKHGAYRKIAITAIVIIIIWVLPVIGYQDITFNSQVRRLEKTLISQGILVNNNIMAKDGEIENTIKGEITDAVDFISYAEKTNTPSWFKEDLNEEKVFKEAFGFEKTYGLYPDESEYISMNIKLMTKMIDISDYSLSINTDASERNNGVNTFQGENGKYEVFISNGSRGIPKITVKLEDGIIMEEDMSGYLLGLTSKYPEQNREIEASFEDMNMILEGEDLSILLVFSNINIYTEKTEEQVEYYVDLQGIYIKYQ
ncbi:MAG TPA: DUF4153 domain-containing protein, partial [Epulopiscium sp.]|nr:DUF4153 domain-containing protein [Candidatus Epulonipiscium sp.]